MLREIEADETPQILVINKADTLEAGQDLTPAALAGRLFGDATLPGAVVSARTGEGVGKLFDLMDGALALDPVSPATFLI